MIPAHMVLTATSNNSVKDVMELMVKNGVGAIVIVEESTSDVLINAMIQPIGIITKSDIVHAYHHQVGVEEPCTNIMSGELETCTPVLDRDQVARILEKNKHHHIIVIDDRTKQFCGLVSSWDIISECSKDDKAWPWIRSEDGRFTNPFAKPDATEIPQAPSPSGMLHTIHHHKHDSKQYSDYVDILGFQ